MLFSRRLVGASVTLVLLTGFDAEAQTLHRYWADLQGDPRVGTTVQQYYAHGRDVANLDVVALTPQSNSMTATKWNNVRAAATAVYVPGTFVAFSGFEWNSGTYGHKTAYYLTDDQPYFPANVDASNHPNEFFALMKGTNGLVHVSHPSLEGVLANWNFHDPSVQVGAEVYSRWGQYETHATNGRALRDAWARGYRLATLATSDTDSLPGTRGGLTAILATDLSRAAILDALRARRTYATSGDRIDLTFRVGDASFGEIVNDVIGSPLIHVDVDGTAPLSRIEIRRSNELVNVYAPAPARVFAEVGGALNYFKGNVEPPADWNVLAFNDAGWLPGRSGVGFGDNDDVTTITGMVNNYLALYTRQTFTVTDNAPQYLYFGVDYDDGFVAYIDGVEVLRVNMPAGPITRTTGALNFREPHLAALAVAGATQAPFYTDNGLSTGTPVDPLLDIYDLSAFSNLLTPGVHVLAIQVHNSFLSSNDVTMIPRLYEPNPATSTTLNFTDAGASGDRFYDVKVTQLNGEMAWSTPIWLNPDAPPRPIAMLSDTPLDNGHSVNLFWTKSIAPDFGWYNIYVSDQLFSSAAGMTPWNDAPIYNADSLTAQIATFNGQPLEPGKTYYAYVGAVDWSGKMTLTTFGAIASGVPSDNQPPQPPAFTSVTDTPADDGGSLQITWGLSPDDGANGDVTAYEIFRRTSTGSYPATALATRVAGSTSYLDTTTDDTKTYFYKVRATDGSNPSLFTAEFGPTASVNNGGLSEPKNVVAADVAGDEGGKIRVTWSLIPTDAAITRYLVYRTITAGTYGAAYGAVVRGTAAFVDSSAAAETDYFYVVVADSANVRRSSWSREAGPVRALDNIAPPRVTVLDAVDNFRGGSVNIAWTYNETGSDVQRYDVYYRDRTFTGVSTLSPIASFPRGTFAGRVDDLSNSVGYYFTVVPVDEADNFFSSSLTTNYAMPTDTTIPTFAGLGSATPGDASVRLHWTPASDNTLPLTYSLYVATTPNGFNFSAPAHTVVGADPIVPLGATWRYFRGTSAPPPGWNQNVYDDSGWLAGEGAFGYDTRTTPLYEFATPITGMDGVFPSVYFRSAFELAELPENLVLGILADDGYIAYINGVEVWRYNLDDPVRHTSLAESGINAPWSGRLDLTSKTNYAPDPHLIQVDISEYAGLLTVGQNVLAIQVHNYKTTNPDFLFLAALAKPNSSFIVEGLDEDITYYFNMRVRDGSGNTNTNAAVVSAQPLAAPPPAAVATLNVAKVGANLRISWSPVTTDITGAALTPAVYNVYRGTSAGFVPDVVNHTNRLASVAATEYQDATALSTPGDLYYKVTAVSATDREGTLPSPLGMKTVRTLAFQAGQVNQHWITVPYLSGIPDAQALVTELNNAPFPGPVHAIERFDPMSQTRQMLRYEDGAWLGVNFPIAAGESYAISLQSTLVLTQVGAHNPNLGLSFAHRTTLSSYYMLGLPYHNTYANVQALMQDLNGGDGATKVTKVVSLNPATGMLETYMYYAGQWLGTNFAITPGQGYAIIVHSDVNGWKPRVQ